MDNEYGLDFLCWVNRCVFFKGDLYKELLLLEIPSHIAVTLSNSNDILRMWQEYGLNDDEWRASIIKYLDYYKAKWDQYE